MIQYENGICEWYDLEGQLLRDTKEVYDSYCELLTKTWDIIKPRLLNNIKGKIIIMGTGGDFDSSNFKDLFFSHDPANPTEVIPVIWPQNYKQENDDTK